MTLLAAYNFDEASGAVIDVTGNAHDITLTGTSTRDPSGHTSKGLKQTTSETSTTLAVFGQTANRTMMAWIKSAAAVADGRFFEFVDPTPESTWEFLFRDTVWHFQAWHATNFVRVTTTRPTDGLWHHFAGTYDGTNLRLYMDGVLVAGPTACAALRTGATVINVMNATSTNMVFDDVRLYDTALDAATITTLMGTPVTAGGTSYTQTPVDAEGLTDARVFDLGKVATDPEALTDSARYDLGKAAADALNLTDTTVVGRGIGNSAADPLGVTDAALLERAVVQVAADNENLTDSASLATGRGLTDNLGLTDQVTADRSQALSDPANLTDSASVQLASAGTVALSDALGLTDTADVTIVRVQPAADTCGLSDQIALVITRDLGDTVTVTDAADLTAAFVRVFADNAALTDQIALVLGGGFGPAVQSVLTAGNAPSSALTPEPRPVLTPSNAPSSHLEVSHGV